MARAPRVSTDEAERARAVMEVEALAERLPVTGGPPESAPPVAVQVLVRDDARGLLERGEVTPEDAGRLWSRLPSYWRWQFAARARRPGLFDETRAGTNARRIGAVDPNG